MISFRYIVILINVISPYSIINLIDACFISNQSLARPQRNTSCSNMREGEKNNVLSLPYSNGFILRRINQSFHQRKIILAKVPKSAMYATKNDENIGKDSSENEIKININDDCNGRKRAHKEIIDPIYILPIITISMISAGLFIFLYEKFSDPMSNSFDVDFYMALEGTLSDVKSTSGESTESIISLPPLTPAEKIVGAFFFGPPTTSK